MDDRRPDDEELELTQPEQFKALAHPLRHRLLFALGQQPATISQLAAAVQTLKGNVAHHLKVLVAAGLVRPAGSKQVRGGTEQYFERTARRLRYADGQSVAVAFQAIADEIAGAEPDPLLVLRYLRLTPQQVETIRAVLTEATETDESPEATERFGLLVGLFKPGHGG